MSLFHDHPEINSRETPSSEQLHFSVFYLLKLWYAREACRKLSSIALEIYKQYVNELPANRAANFEGRNVKNCVKLWYAREACRKLSSIALEIYKQYVNELRANRAANFEASNVQNCVKLWYARQACRKLSSTALEIYKQYVDELRCKFWS